MADIINASSGYQTGSIDTATTLVNNVSPTDAKHVNGPAGAIVQIETILGPGTTLKGSAADLATRLGIAVEANGKLKDLSATTKTTFPTSVAEAGTGAVSFTDGAVLVGNGTGALQAVALPSSLKVLSHSGTAGADPAWITGLLFQGPTSCETGSTRTHEGAVTISSNGNYSGIHYYSDFTLNSGVTMTIPANAGRLVIIASNSITINGTITGAGAGLLSGPGAPLSAPSSGFGGTSQPGGGGGASTVYDGGNGGGLYVHGLLRTAGGVAGINGAGTRNGSNGTQQTGSSANILDWINCFGGATGGAGAGNDSFNGGAGGAGGASIILIAPTIILASTATLNTSGTAGGSVANNLGAGGGGGGGNVIIITRSYTDNTATFTLTGGAGGTIGTGGGTGGNGATGIRQILIYA